MNSASWQKIKEFFNATIDLPEGERANLLQNCEAGIRVEVEKLLAAHSKADGFIAEPAMVEIGFTEDDQTDAFVGQRIDSYEILREIGRGGMGTVYLAKHADESFDKKVAVKLINRGMDTTAVLKRFMIERSILARLEHNFIARLIDGGTTADGLPYFVMEYVEGEPITKFCAAHDYSIEERLKIFQSVCAAVSYAHQNLVVHRDLKPSNILITADGTPKLLDFGIAKLLNPDWSLDTAEATATMMRLLTPEYASPEQLRGLHVTTASDVYSLGVVLYELLSGQRPFKLESRLPEEAAKVVLTEEPVRPSSVVSGLWSAVNKNTNENEPPETNDKQNPKSKIQNPKLLRGDLDNIILKALRKEPERRYASVQEFSEDIRRHLVGLPVSATADTSFYRFTKFIKRHRAGVFAAILIVLTLLVATAVTTRQAYIARVERNKAEQRFNQARELARTVLFDYHDKIKELPGATAVREKLVTDTLKYLDNLAQESENSTDLQREIAQAYRKVGEIQGGTDSGNLGKTGEALNSYRKALEIQEKLAAQNPAHAEDQRMLANLYLDVGQKIFDTGDYQGTENYYRKTFEIFSQAQKNAPDDIKANSDLARIRWFLAGLARARNDLNGALDNYGQAVEIYQKLAAVEPANKKHIRNVALTYKTMGAVLQLQHEPAKALEIFQKALTIDSENAAAQPNDVSVQLDLSFTLASVASVQRDAKNYQESVENYRKALEIREKAFAADPKNVMAQTAVARAYKEIGITLMSLEQKEAGKNLEQSVSIYEQLVEADKENTTKKTHLAETLTMLGRAYGKTGNLAAAGTSVQNAISIFSDLSSKDKNFASRKVSFSLAYQVYGEILLKNGNAQSALENFHKAQEVIESEQDETPERLSQAAAVYEGIADAKFMLSKKAESLNEAKTMYQKSLDIWRDLQQKGRLVGEDFEKLREIPQKIAGCETALAKL